MIVYPALECRKVFPELSKILAAFFHDLKESGDSKFFHPHPLTLYEAERICCYTGKDLYYVLIEDSFIIGYGMLRGWDQGYETPNLGIAIHPSERCKGIGVTFMHFLHAAAKRKGATKVRLKVYPANIAAIKLYTALGYVFDYCDMEQLVGMIELL